tara:strand:- start:193 stop:477 length:285 start_codon:yes stop_codon:yes gene_type:complete
LDDNKLRAIFNQFDTDSSGIITRENIAFAMSKIGHEITEEELDEVMKEHDLDHNGEIDYEEFKAIFVEIGGNANAINKDDEKLSIDLGTPLISR